MIIFKQFSKYGENIKHFKRIFTTAIIITIGLLLFKYLPMKIFGKDILFDASAHITIAMLVLYTLWFFIDQVKTARLPYLMVSTVVIIIIAFQRIIDNAHNDIGLLLGFIIGLLAIMISESDHLKKYLEW